MNGVDNMLYMYSVNANNGQATVYVDFDVKTNPDTDQVLSQLRVSQAQSQLPAQVNTAGLIVQKSLTSPLMLIGLSSPDGKYDVNFLTNYAIINLQDELTRIPGVAASRYLAASMLCVCGSIPISWPSSASPPRTSSMPSRSRTT